MRNINLENDSENENVIISVNEGSLRLELAIFTRLTKGSVDIEIYSPSGKKEWNISIGSQAASYKEEHVTGTIKKMLTEPDSGEWIVKLNPENASGSISINSKTVEN